MKAAQLKKRSIQLADQVSVLLLDVDKAAKASRAKQERATPR